MSTPKPKKNKEKIDSEHDFSKRQITVIKETVNTMLKNAKYGNNQDFLRNMRRIYDAASKIELQLEGE
ncbi:MAG: hypothetical protein KGI25_07695 [Thaumarchaeota archaeon]|nr:hypothetical protein [Nitrososphaerota archaeon]